jgi:hypothetical protein
MPPSGSPPPFPGDPFSAFQRGSIEAERLRNAWLSYIVPMPTGMTLMTAELLAALGWTPDDIARVGQWSRRGIEGAWAGRLIGQPSETLAARLIRWVQSCLAPEKCSRQETLDWLVLIALADSFEAARAVEDAWGGSPTIPGAPGADVLALRRAVPAGEAPLAFAAGLDADEAAARIAQGAWNPGTLRMMAGLRGYRLPPVIAG